MYAWGKRQPLQPSPKLGQHLGIIRKLSAPADRNLRPLLIPLGVILLCWHLKSLYILLLVYSLVYSYLASCQAIQPVTLVVGISTKQRLNHIFRWKANIQKFFCFHQRQVKRVWTNQRAKPVWGKNKYSLIWLVFSCQKAVYSTVKVMLRAAHLLIWLKYDSICPAAWTACYHPALIA